MMKRKIFLLIVACSITSALHARNKKQPLSFEILQAKMYSVYWDDTSGQVGDFNCDGQPDAAYMGHNSTQVVVAVLLGPLSQESRISTIRLRAYGDLYDAVDNPNAVL